MGRGSVSQAVGDMDHVISPPPPHVGSDKSITGEFICSFNSSHLKYVRSILFLRPRPATHPEIQKNWRGSVCL